MRMGLETFETIRNDLETPNFDVDKIRKQLLSNSPFPNCKNTTDFEPLTSEKILGKFSQ